jgi:DNA-binding NarL/FixJ family response regulator
MALTAVASIEGALRANDRVCPYGLSRIAVAFGPEAEAVAPKVLCDRLARTVGRGLLRHLQTERLQQGVTCLSASRPGRRRASLGNGANVEAARAALEPIPSTTVVVVERLLGRAPAVPGAMVPSAVRSPGQPWIAADLRLRTTTRSSTRRLAGYGTRHDDYPPHGTDSLGTLLVVDPTPTSLAPPGLAALASGALAERLGFTTGVVAMSGGGDVVTEIGGNHVDLVVLIVGAEPSRAHHAWATSTWSIPMALSQAYHSMGIDVLVVSAGASAGALVGCLEHGAWVLLDLNALPNELVTMSENGAPGKGRSIERTDSSLPESIQTLLTLTSSERRVLFYLTVGESAQEIADDLFVSLATVRSHIRSILRKLGVRSQLAAVALANSRVCSDARVELA